MSKLLDNVTSELQRLPSIGRRTALRLAMHILKMDTSTVDSLAASIERFRHEIRYCTSATTYPTPIYVPFAATLGATAPRYASSSRWPT